MSGNTINPRDLIRETVLNTKPDIILVPYGPTEIELRTPDLESLNAFRNNSALDPMAQDPQIMAKMIVGNCYVPGTNGQDKVFEEGDIPVIMKLAYSKDMQRLIKEIGSLMGDDKIAQDIEDDTKSTEE